MLRSFVLPKCGSSSSLAKWRRLERYNLELDRLYTFRDSLVHRQSSVSGTATVFICEDERGVMHREMRAYEVHAEGAAHVLPRARRDFIAIDWRVLSSSIDSQWT